MRRFAAILCLLAFVGAASLQAQYFGQNKVRHQQLDFQVLKTQHFDIYYYPSEKAATEEVGRMAERWNDRLSHLLHHVLSTRQPLILYASHTDFEQTTVLPGLIDAATGGVTLATGRKVVLPLAGSLRETDHVLGHELVHAFQYDMTTSRGSQAPGIARLPLWFVEGMAEYLSLGPDDANTAMWMRDVVAHDKMPTVKALNNPNKYFPYRFGQAFWAYVGGRYGDDVIAPLLLRASDSGNVNAALQSVLHVDEKQLSADWKAATLAADQPVLQATAAVPVSSLVVAATRGQSRLNVSPAVSPDGNWVIFYSERGLFSIELYLANAHTGKVVRQLTSTAISAHFNNLEFINSAGAWAAGSRRFAYGHVESAVGKIAVYDLQQQKVVRDYPIPGVGEVFNPTWSPDGRQIAFSAIAGGFTNLYLLNLDSGAVRKLTDDRYAELQPAWSPDGRTLAFVTDRFTANLDDLSHGNFRLALMDMASGAVTPAVSAGGGDQTNPQWAPGGQILYFVSDANGIANLYEAPLDGGLPRQLTSLQTGISGITYLSPAMSVAQQSGDIIYSLYHDGLYSLVRLAPRPPAVAGLPAGLHPAILPPRTAATGAVAAMLTNFATGLAVAGNFTQHPYHPTLQLDGFAPPSIAVGVGSYGTLLGGGTALHFSDLLNYHELTVAFESLSTGGGSGFVRNLSASAVYLNHEHRWTWGLAGGQTPFVSGTLSAVAGTLNGRPVVQTTTFTQWELDRDAVGILAYPFNRAQRVEFTAGYSNIGFAAETETLTEDLITGALLGDQRQNQPAPKALNFGVATAALVYDTSIFGGVSPVLGQSYRFQAGLNAGSIDFSTVLLDYRKYLSLARPVSVAGRLLHFGRYGAGADDPRLQPLFLGYPSIVRGYEFNSFSTSECGAQFQATGACPAFDRLLGSKIASGSLEARFELLGPLGILRTPQIPPVELAPFFDTGVAWTALDKPDFLGGNRRLVSSEGLTLRVNALGFAVVAIDYAIPNNRTRSHVWEFTFLPGY